MTRHCEVCGGPVSVRNLTGVCIRNDQCRKESARRRAIRVKQNRMLNRRVNGLCEVCGEPLGATNERGVCTRYPACFRENKLRARDTCAECGNPKDRRSVLCRTCNNKHKRPTGFASEESRYIKAAWNRAGERARKFGVPFSIAISDITPVPENCQACGKEFSRRRSDKLANPSIDRVIPSLGYIRENVWWICVGCNGAKGGESSLDHRRQLAESHEHRAELQRWWIEVLTPIEEKIRAQLALAA